MKFSTVNICHEAHDIDPEKEMVIYFVIHCNSEAMTLATAKGKAYPLFLQSFGPSISNDNPVLIFDMFHHLSFSVSCHFSAFLSVLVVNWNSHRGGFTCSNPTSIA